LVADEFIAFLVGEMDSLASATKNDKTTDTTLDEEERVLSLCLKI
jgi:hypothetical protein